MVDWENALANGPRFPPVRHPTRLPAIWSLVLVGFGANHDGMSMTDVDSNRYVCWRALLCDARIGRLAATRMAMRMAMRMAIPVAMASACADARRPVHAFPPDAAIPLFERAVASAQAGHRANALQQLDSLRVLPGGLDPSFHRTFLDWHGDTSFARIVAAIRAANPAIVRSTVMYQLREQDLQPEGLAFDPDTRALFIGSFKGKILRIDHAGVVSVFAVLSRSDRRHVVVGLRVDTVRHHLWAVADDPQAFGNSAVSGGALHQYDIRTGRLLAQHHLPGPGAFNDLVVTADGTAYATNTVDGSIWRTAQMADDAVSSMTADTSNAMHEFLPPGTAPDANGIAWDALTNRLFVAARHTVVRVDMATATTRAMANHGDLPLGSFDGLYWYAGGLIGIQNGVHPGRVVRMHLDTSATQVLRTEVLERYHPQFGGMTTAAIDGSSLFYIVNTQSRAFRADGSHIPGRPLTDILIARLPLN